MRSVLVLSLSCAALMQGCDAQGPALDPRTISVTTATGLIEGRPTLGAPHPIPGQSTVLVPFAVESEKGLFERSDPYDRGGISYGHAYARRPASSIAPGPVEYGGSVRWHNAVVRDLKTGEEWPILDRRGIIGQWEAVLIQPDPQKPCTTRALVFIAVLADTNADTLLDDRDARVAILTDADGRNPRVVTPTDAHVWRTFYDSGTDSIYFQIATDTTCDGQVTADDIAVPYVLSAGGDGTAQRVISPRLASHLEQILNPTGSIPAPAPRAQTPEAPRLARRSLHQ